MLLSQLEKIPMQTHVKTICELLVEIIDGNYPKVNNFSEQEIYLLMHGENLEDIVTPFKRLKKSMTVQKLPIMRLKTTRDVYFRKRQMSLYSLFETINKMLAILQIEAEKIENEECLLGSRMY